MRCSCWFTNSLYLCLPRARPEIEQQRDLSPLLCGDELNICYGDAIHWQNSLVLFETILQFFLDQKSLRAAASGIKNCSFASSSSQNLNLPTSIASAHRSKSHINDVRRSVISNFGLRRHIDVAFFTVKAREIAQSFAKRIHTEQVPRSKGISLRSLLAPAKVIVGVGCHELNLARPVLRPQLCADRGTTEYRRLPPSAP